MKKKTVSILFLAAVIFLALVSIVITAWLLQKSQYHTNTAELYSNFTNSMKTKVNSYLASIDCEPKEYSFAENTVCLPCGDLEACFDYVWINRDGRKMNFMNTYLKGDANMQTKISFYSKGLTKLLNCKCSGNNCECDDGLKTVIAEDSTEGKLKQPLIMFEYKGDIKEEAQKISSKLNYGECVFYENEINSFSCGNATGVIVSKEVFFFAI